MTPTLHFTFDCRRCRQAAVRAPDDAQPIRGSGRGLPPSAERPVMGYIVRCSHCGTDNVVRPEDAHPAC